MLKSFELDGRKSSVIICLIGPVCSLCHAKCRSQKVVDYPVSQIKIGWTVRAPLLQFSFAWKLRTIVISLCQSVWNQTSLQNRILTGLTISIFSKLFYYIFNKIRGGLWGFTLWCVELKYNECSICCSGVGQYTCTKVEIWPHIKRVFSIETNLY